MPINSRAKGKRGELAAAKFFKEHGYEARRSQQYAGINNDADIVGVPYLHLEIKARENLDIYDAISQAKRDAKEGEIPTVMWKRNNHKWLIIQEADDWINLYREWEVSENFKRGEHEQASKDKEMLTED